MAGLTLAVPSGAEVVINCAPFQDALVLKHAIEREAAIALTGGMISTILIVDSSPAVNDALWPCLARCTYQGQKIQKSTFDAKESRADYYPVIRKCIEENLGPLGESLYSQFLAQGLLKKTEATKEGQKSELKTSAG